VRLEKLELLAYGPFRGLELDLARPGLHVVFGRNEAGKSTTLRAIAALLYGIAARTQDAHTHKPSDLRIAGVLAGEGGERVRVVRRKGNANTLLDDAGAPIDEAVVLRLLRGVSEETFKTAFGLDHERLRSGAQALLDGRGDLGESLFDASVGGGGEVQRLLHALAAEADAIYKPRASALPLNEALKTFSDAQKQIRQSQTSPDAHMTQLRGIEATRAVRAATAARRAEAAATRAAIERARRILPLERRLAAAVEERAALAQNAAAAARETPLTARARSPAARSRAKQGWPCGHA
jgi:uncharacterized protein YhaN